MSDHICVDNKDMRIKSRSLID